MSLSFCSEIDRDDAHCVWLWCLLVWSTKDNNFSWFFVQVGLKIQTYFQWGFTPIASSKTSSRANPVDKLKEQTPILSVWHVHFKKLHTGLETTLHLQLPCFQSWPHLFSVLLVNEIWRCFLSLPRVSKCSILLNREHMLLQLHRNQGKLKH